MIADTLIEDGTFSLPGQKALVKSGAEYVVLLVDATETPIERPKKTKEILLSKEKRNALERVVDKLIVHNVEAQQKTQRSY